VVSTTVERPVAVVWRWCAVEHVRNHPRWDPDMEMEQISEGPIGLGTRIRRRNVRWGKPIEGEMEIVEWEPERVMATRIHDANMDMAGRFTFQQDRPDRTVPTIAADIPDLDEAKTSHLSAMMQRSAKNVKLLAESDLQPACLAVPTALPAKTGRGTGPHPKRRWRRYRGVVAAPSKPRGRGGLPNATSRGYPHAGVLNRIECKDLGDAWIRRVC
jgi:hypothetical protein